MAKSKSKAKKRTLFKQIAIGSSIILGLVAFFMMFAPAIVNKDVAELSYTGTQITFGLKRTAGALSVEIYKFSFMNLLPYILVLGGVVVTVLNIFGKASKFGAFIAIALYLVAGVFFFLALTFALPTTVSNEYFKLGAGPIVSGIFSILAALVSTVPFFVKK